MLGVVLWSDEAKNRAVVWCDDHGDLAFYRPDTPAQGPSVEFRPGDLIQFDLKEAAELRMVTRPRLVEKDSHPSLTQKLKAVGVGKSRRTASSPKGATTPTPGMNADVIPLFQARCA